MGAPSSQYCWWKVPKPPGGHSPGRAAVLGPHADQRRVHQEALEAALRDLHGTRTCLRLRSHWGRSCRVSLSVLAGYGTLGLRCGRELPTSVPKAGTDLP